MFFSKYLSTLLCLRVSARNQPKYVSYYLFNAVELFILLCDYKLMCMFFLICFAGISKMFSRVPITPSSDFSTSSTVDVPSFASTTNAAVPSDDQPGMCTHFPSILILIVDVTCYFCDTFFPSRSRYFFGKKTTRK